jgi:hypothetical protein
MNKIFQYIGLALDLGGSVESIIALLKTKPVTGAGLLAAIQPALSGVQTTFNVSIPDTVVTDICDAAAAAINKYVSK